MPQPALGAAFSAVLQQLIRVRQEIHRHPELGFDEFRTQDLVMRWLTERGFSPRKCAGTGVVADLHPDRAPALALRADLDALPIQETLDLPYRSVADGVSHKCGHDGHTAIMLGVATLLAERRAEIAANVRLIFQPAEEGVDGGGAKVMIAEGVLEGVPAIYGLHNWPGFAKGTVQVTAGPTMAAVDTFELRLTGRGGHGSQPQTCRDPIVAGAQIVGAVQTVVSRGIGALDAAVVSFGSFQAGRANNVIPSTADLTGSIRSLDAAVRQCVHQRLREVIAGVAVAMGVDADCQIDREYPVLANDADCTAIVERVAGSVGLEVSSAGLPLLASEDFAFFADAVPAAYFFLGAGIPGVDTPSCHHPDFDFDDDLIEPGVRMLLGIIESYGVESYGT